MNIKEKCNHDWVESRKEYDWVMCGLCKEERKATDLIKDLEHEIGGLQAENDKIKLLPQVCGICWTSSFEPTEDGERCLCCWQHERIMELIAENERLGKELDEQQKINVTLESFI